MSMLLEGKPLFTEIRTNFSLSQAYWFVETDSQKERPVLSMFSLILLELLKNVQCVVGNLSVGQLIVFKAIKGPMKT